MSLLLFLQRQCLLFPQILGFLSHSLGLELEKVVWAYFIKHEDSEILALLDMETSPGERFGEVSQSLAFVKELTWR